MHRSILLLFLLLPLIGTTQTVDLDQSVTFSFEEERLGYILSEISRQYAIPFAYSSNFIPVDKKVSVVVRQLPLREALNQLFATTKIVYALIGNSIVLKVDESKKVIPIIKSSSERENAIEKSVPPPLPIRDTRITQLLREESLPLLKKYRPIPQVVLDSLKNLPILPKIFIPSIYEDSPYREMAQITLVPSISTNVLSSDSITNTFSLNILCGINGGVEGLEVAGFGNILRNNMKGLQVAGIWNRVDGNVSGTQFASAVNHNIGYTRGLQFTLGVNITNEAKAIQLAGLVNIVKEAFAGLQLALIGNFVRTRSNGLQIGGIYNYSRGYAYQQFSLGYNKAREVEKIQVGFINSANYVKGKQIGLLNLSDEIEGTPIGLLNIVKKGYNRIEVGGGESLFANFGFKLGTRKFYNIIQFGYRFTNDTWSLGYGIGTGIKIANKQHVHLEWVLSHVNEGDWWTTGLNWLNQCRFTYDWQISKQHTSLFLGPTFNWLISKVSDSETGLIVGSALPSYTLLDSNRTNTNWKIWFGATAGLRF